MEKKGKIYSISKKYQWAYSHVHKPTPILFNKNKLKIYFGTRNIKKKTVTSFIDVDPSNPSRILYEHNKPVLGLGKLGTFDDAGANVSNVVKHKDKLYMYYIGWNTSTTVPHRNSIGLAVSNENGLNFKRLYDGPIMDRTKTEPYFTVAPFVMREKGLWKMWYTSGTKWTKIDGKPEINYHIKYAESADGINWKRKNISCIKPKHKFEANARPWVIKVNNTYHMWYCYRNNLKFRKNSKESYRIGYARSADGINWKREDDKVGINVSKRGWDSSMIEYPAIYKFRDSLYMLYNGNGFGTSGMGYAKLKNYKKQLSELK